MASYKRRVDICKYPTPAVIVAIKSFDVVREGDTLIFEKALQKLEFDRAVKAEVLNGIACK